MCKMPCFRERLNQLFINSGKTIVDFAKTLGTSRQSLGYYLNGERIPDAHMVKQICERCHISADWLLGLSDVKSPEADLKAVCDYVGLSEKSIIVFKQMNRNNEKVQRIIQLIDVFWSNDKSRASFLIALLYLYEAYREKEQNNDLFLDGLQEIGQRIDINDEKQKSELFNIELQQLQLQTLSGNDRVEFKMFVSKKSMNNALDDLFSSDDLLALYQKELTQEESENGQS